VTAIRRRPETLLQGVLLAVVGGYLDAFTFVRFGVFANAQTGNVVLLGVDAASGYWHAAFLKLTPVLVFMVGIVIVEQLARRAAYQRLPGHCGSRSRWRSSVSSSRRRCRMRPRSWW
jgi:uncharacterized membrane protein YoaK (UPF0700 family)